MSSTEREINPGEYAMAPDPLHYVIRLTKGPQIVELIKEYHSVHPPCIHQPDSFGNTPLQTAIAVDNQLAVQTLRGLEAADNVRRAQIEAGAMSKKDSELAQKLRPWIVATEKMRRSLEGYSDEELIAEFTTDHMEGMPSDLEEYIKQRKWGCSCGTCENGWLSPRMRFRLNFQTGGMPSRFLAESNIEVARVNQQLQVGSTEYTALPTCANDLNFGLVRRGCGLPPSHVEEREKTKLLTTAELIRRAWNGEEYDGVPVFPC